MALFINNGKNLTLDDSNLGLYELHLIEKLWSLFKEHGYDIDAASTGVRPCPDFGYFDLSSRYWRGALCIYFAGFCKAFIEAGAGFLEPWLFNVRHAVELSLKGCLLYASWYEELSEDPLASGYKTQLEQIENDHNLQRIYHKYHKKVNDVVEKWDIEEFGEFPKIEDLVLSKRGKAILDELSEADQTGFRFRYPSLRTKQKHQKLQEVLWRWDESGLLPETGLPKVSGTAFNHIKVINALHDLNRELSKIHDINDAFYSYLDEVQGLAFEGL